MTDYFERLNAALADRYTIERELGAGGMATVYLAEDMKLHRKVALKVLRPELASALGPDRFLQEIDIAANLQHPNILALYDSGEADGFLFYVMPYIEGPSLRDKLAQQGELPIGEAVRILRDIVDALTHAHKHSVVHRDMKPDNVMLSDRHALVTDFGVAKAVSEATGRQQLTTEGVALGTPAYMAPEQAAADPHIDHRADIYAVGVIAYELLTGRTPFVGTTQQELLAAHVTQIPDPVTRYRESVPPALAALVMKCLEKKAADRWQSTEELLVKLESLAARNGAENSEVLGPLLQIVKRPSVALPATVLVLILCAIAVWQFTRNANLQWARTEAIPEIRRLADEGEYESAFALAEEVEQYVPNDTALVALWSVIAARASIKTTPEGATVHIRDYGAVDADWQLLGRTPINDLRISRGFKRFRIIKDGYATVEGAAAISPTSPTLEKKLYPLDSIPPEMVAVAGGPIMGWLTGIDFFDIAEVGDFLIDKHEVTNAQYKEFVDSGGYQRPEFWRRQFVQDGRILSWEDAIAKFRDATNRPGPATWELGDFPNGLEDHPVGGVSWYEAAAYAEFAGKSLPTIYHWISAAGTMSLGTFIIPLSNFSGDTTAPVGSYQGMSPSGAYDMAGNVREWVWNESRNERYILGGAWNQPSYTFSFAAVQDPFDRSPINGFRCAGYVGVSGMPAESSRPVEMVVRDYDSETPVSQSVFEAYKSQFLYDDSGLNATIERTAPATEDFTSQVIAFDATYSDERVIAHLFLPVVGTSPYQTVIVFPGSGAILANSSDRVASEYEEFILPLFKSGRAVLFPIYAGTYERNDGLTSTWPNDTHRYTDYVRKWVMDFRRSLDYLETREDIDIDRLAFVGFSWGARMGAIIPAVEERIKVSILYSGGLAPGRARPEVDQINYVTRVATPVLMLNGRFDAIEPVETAQLPMFRLLGTREEDKRHLLYEAGHYPLPRIATIREMPDWLDRYLGPVR